MRRLSHLHRNLVRSAALTLALIAGQGLDAQTKEDCLVCHSDPDLSTERNGRPYSLFVNEATYQGSAHGDLDCDDCHAGFNAEEMPHSPVISKVDCLQCHEVKEYAESVHAKVYRRTKSGATCVDCHGTHDILPSSNPSSQVARSNVPTTCGRCHTSVLSHFDRSDHGRALAGGVKGAPVCTDCHGEHNVQTITSSASPVSRMSEAAVCLHCHLDDPEVRQRVGPSASFIASYENSIHAIALKEGNSKAAVCSDCHGGHDMMKGSNPSSRVYKTNIAATCGSCHVEEASVYAESIHGVEIAKGNLSSPTCTDCHGEHQILPPGNPNSPVSARNVSSQVCSPCHTSVKLVEKFNLPADRYKTFADSYHGLANRAGDVEVANCASCHGYHDIKPSGDPSSSINKANLAKTCGKCHPGANENFAQGSVHVIASNRQDALLYWVSTSYIVLIVVLVGGMVLHNIVDFVKKGRRKLLVRRGYLEHEQHGHGLYLRMSLNERLQHGALIVSFITLVVTGFMLRFPDAWWVVAIRSLSERAFEIRGIVHRVAGVVLILSGLWHLYYVFFVLRGKQLLRDLIPKRQDLRDMAAVLKCNLGISRTKPLFGRFSYVEKVEYWALVWGTIVMGLTGFILWFDNFFLGLLTKSFWDVARAIHYYEAWLATLAIIVWHLYYVLLNPDVYPMNLAWITGTITEEEMADEHPLELAELKDEEARILRQGASEVENEQQNKVEKQELIARNPPENGEEKREKSGEGDAKNSGSRFPQSRRRSQR